MDGFCRLTRIAEAFYYDFYTKNSSANSYSIVIEGMNHYQFVGNGTVPDYIKWEDLNAEISDSDALDNVTTITIAFMKSSLCEYFGDCINQRSYLSQRAAKNVDLISPILTSFKIEGFLYMYPPCNEFPHLSPPNCLLGSPWSEHAQNIMGTLNEKLNLNVSVSIFINIFSTYAKVYVLCQLRICPNLQIFFQSENVQKKFLIDPQKWSKI